MHAHQDEEVDDAAREAESHNEDEGDHLHIGGRSVTARAQDVPQGHAQGQKQVEEGEQNAEDAHKSVQGTAAPANLHVHGQSGRQRISAFIS